MLPFIRQLSRCFCAASLMLLVGCVVPQSRVAELRNQNQNLAEQNRAQLTEIANLRELCSNTEDQLRQAEEQSDVLEKRLSMDHEKITDYEKERETIRRQYVAAMNGETWLSAHTQSRLAELAKRYPHLKFDPHTGVAKLDNDILFDSGQTELKPGAEQLLKELASILRRPETGDLRVMVVGHTDDRQIAKMPGRDLYQSNFDLSAARSLAVANRLKGFGIEPKRIGVAGFGGHQPIAANSSARDRYKNRRVEIFVMAPEVPIVGWTETTPSVY